MNLNKTKEYLNIVNQQLSKIEESESKNIEDAANVISDTLEKDGLIYIFGTGHSQMFSLEMFYRAGGLVPVHPMLEASVAMYTGTKTSEYERVPDIGKVIFKKSGMTSKDTLIIVSHSGRNPMPVDLAESAKAAGVSIITIASGAFMAGVSSRHPSGKFVKDFADVIIDNHCDLGDAVIDIEGMSTKVAGTSSILSIAIIESIVATTINICVNRGFTPPVWMSGNLDNGDAHNEQHYLQYRNRIPYL
ncbi:hypothetical protein CJP72_02960 [Citrobacter sp. NCU1]|uniref:sugar isomerase domain-containing protein n=1 Tax=Citrobacter sp. NCU1 TaxID=2026683 RepID=UPI001390D317|nr:SIS domain-containing protein [Citrobacter sp. NCU1]NDO79768.1 hypothetical protein [Citrobacter sp. NCU1]